MKLSIRQAYLSMFCLLEAYYRLEKHDGLGVLLGAMNMNICGDGMPADEALWSDWLRSVSQVSPNNELSVEEAFRAMLAFLKLCYSVSWNVNKYIELFEKSENIDNKLWNNWLACVNKSKER